MRTSADIQKKELPETKLEELGVLAVYLFGSYAENTNGNLSDIDVAVLLRDESAARGNTNELYIKLYNIFSECFDTGGFKDMDIVFLERAPLELAFNIIRNGRVIYSRDDYMRLAYENRVSLLYKDFRPILKRFDSELIKSL